jgi:hypothetical protein
MTREAYLRKQVVRLPHVQMLLHLQKLSLQQRGSPNKWNSVDTSWSCAAVGCFIISLKYRKLRNIGRVAGVLGGIIGVLTAVRRLFQVSRLQVQ